MTMDIFPLHMNTTYTLHVYHIHYMYYDLPMISYKYISQRLLNHMVYYAPRLTCLDLHTLNSLDHEMYVASVHYIVKSHTNTSMSPLNITNSCGGKFTWGSGKFQDPQLMYSDLPMMMSIIENI